MPFPFSFALSEVVSLSDRMPRRNVVAGALSWELRHSGADLLPSADGLVRFLVDPVVGLSRVGFPSSQLSWFITEGEVEIIERVNEVELAAEARVSRLPFGLGAVALIACMLLWGRAAIPTGIGALVGLVAAFWPWWLARLRMQGVLMRTSRRLTDPEATSS